MRYILTFLIILGCAINSGGAFAEDQRVMNDFKHKVDNQSAHAYKRYAPRVKVGKDPYTVTYSDSSAQKNAARWNRPENYRYDFNPVSPQKDPITPQRAWGK